MRAPHCAKLGSGRSTRTSRPLILLHRGADERAEKRGRIGRMRIIVRILVIAAAPCVTELFDQQVPRDDAAGDHATRTSSRCGRPASSRCSERSGGGSSMSAPASAAEWPLSARYCRTTCAALTGETTASAPPWMTSNGTGSGVRLCPRARLARDPRDVGVGAAFQHAQRGHGRRRRAARDARMHEHAGDQFRLPYPSTVASAPRTTIPATNTRLRSIRYLRRTERTCARHDRGLAPPPHRRLSRTSSSNPTRSRVGSGEATARGSPRRPLAR